MSSADASQPSRARAWLMVAVQAFLFLLVAVAAITPPLTLLSVGTGWRGTASQPWWGLAVIVVGSAGMVLAGRDLGRALTPLPIPNGEGLVARGVYRWVRHPMYSALVVICGGVAIASGTPQSWLMVGAIAVFFAVKARMEERYLLSAYPGYADYARRTGRFMPGIGRIPGGSESQGTSESQP